MKLLKLIFSLDFEKNLKFESVYKNDQIQDFFRNWYFLFWIDFSHYWYRGLKSNLELKNSFPSKLELDAVSAKLAVTCLVKKCYVQGWKCRKINFYWVIASPKHDCVVVEWNLGFNEKYFNISFWTLSGAVCRVLSSFSAVSISTQSAHNDFNWLKRKPLDCPRSGRNMGSGDIWQ